MKVCEDIYLTRLIKTDTETTGFMTVIDGQSIQSCFTLELPWKDNQKNISCIPAGVYHYKKWYSKHFNTVVIRLLDVPDRTNILIHPANYVRELRGCIAPGLTKRDIDNDGKIDVAQSRKALDKILAIISDNGFIHINNI